MLVISAWEGANNGSCSQVSHVDWSQQGRRKALTASLLQMAHRSLNGMSSGAIVLHLVRQDISRYLCVGVPGDVHETCRRVRRSHGWMRKKERLTTGASEMVETNN